MNNGNFFSEYDDIKENQENDDPLTKRNEKYNRNEYNFSESKKSVLADISNFFEIDSENLSNDNSFSHYGEEDSATTPNLNELKLTDATINLMMKQSLAKENNNDRIPFHDFICSSAKTPQSPESINLSVAKNSITLLDECYSSPSSHDSINRTPEFVQIFRLSDKSIVVTPQTPKSPEQADFQKFHLKLSCKNNDRLWKSLDNYKEANSENDFDHDNKNDSQFLPASVNVSKKSDLLNNISSIEFQYLPNNLQTQLKKDDLNNAIDLINQFMLDAQKDTITNSELIHVVIDLFDERVLKSAILAIVYLNRLEIIIQNNKKLYRKKQ